MAMIGKISKVLITFLIIIFLFTSVAFGEERMDGYFTVLVEETQDTLFATARYITIGDKFLSADNKLYEIVSIDQDTAQAKFIEDVDLSGYLESSLISMSFWQTVLNAQGENAVGIYHTHSAESYPRSDGQESIAGAGGIVQVGRALANAIEKNGVKAIHTDKSHDPQDSNAYQRSRRTAAELLQQGADALIDVHRDAVPLEKYLGEVEGKKVAQIQLVVGRQNPQMKANDEFAKKLKAQADEMYPGLIKGIFYARGSYNQELTPSATLLEVGTVENSREAAEESVVMFADIFTAALYGKGGQQAVDPNKSAARGSSSAILWIVGLLIIGGGIFLFISMGGSKEMASKLPGIFKKRK
jgi:stage II sporulation protein P